MIKNHYSIKDVIFTALFPTFFINMRENGKETELRYVYLNFVYMNAVHFAYNKMENMSHYF